MKPQSESQIQKACVRWFELQYPAIKILFFAVPNGGARNAWTAKIMKDEGVRAGVSDLVLLLPRSGYAYLCIEMKKPEGKQSDSQREFQRMVEKAKGRYVVCHSLEEFIKVVREYIG